MPTPAELAAARDTIAQQARQIANQLHQIESLTGANDALTRALTDLCAALWSVYYTLCDHEIGSAVAAGIARERIETALGNDAGTVPDIRTGHRRAASGTECGSQG